MLNLYPTPSEAALLEETTTISSQKKLQQSHRKSAGFIFIAVGALVGFLSVVLCIINPMPELFNYFLYGFTLLAIGFIFPGLYLIFEN